MSIKSYNRLNRQIPDNIRKKYPKFVEFLRAYYSWMEQPDNPYYHLRNHLSFLDFEESLDSYIEQMKNEYLFSLPQEILGNKELFIKYSKQFNLSIGTEESFEFLFNILYNENVELYYPKTDILRASDGEWIQSETTLFLTSIDKPENFTNQKIIQYNEDGDIIASAIVENVKRRFVKQFEISELIVSNIQGEFLRDIRITLENDTSVEEFIMPVGLTVNIQNKGINYRQGDVLQVPQNETFEKTGAATQNEIYDTKVSSSLSITEIEFYLNGQFIDPNLFDFDGQFIYYSNITIGDQITVVMPVFQGFIIVDNVNQAGEIQKLKIIETPIGVNGAPILLQSNDGGTGAEIYLSYAPVKKSEGFYRNRKGWLSSDKVLQDSNFYQEFSYVLKTSQDITKYRDIVLDVLHPAGMKLFGQINILSLINLMITDHSLDIEKFIPADIVLSEKVALGPTYSFLDKMKTFIDDELLKAEDYIDLTLEDFEFNNNKRKFNIADVKITLQACIDEYFETGMYEFGYVCEGVNDNDSCIDNYTNGGYYNFGYICDE